MQPPMPQPAPAQGAPDVESQEQAPDAEGQEPQGAPPQGATDPKQVVARLAIAATKAIYADKATTDQIVQMLKQGADNPAEAVCNVAIHIMDGLSEKVSGGVPKQVAYVPEVAMGLIGELGELGQHVGAFKFGDREAQQAEQYLTEKVRQRLGGGAQPGQPQPQQQQPPPGAQAQPSGTGMAQPSGAGGGLLNQEVY